MIRRTQAPATRSKNIRKAVHGQGHIQPSIHQLCKCISECLPADKDKYRNERPESVSESEAANIIIIILQKARFASAGNRPYHAAETGYLTGISFSYRPYANKRSNPLERELPIHIRCSRPIHPYLRHQAPG